MYGVIIGFMLLCFALVNLIGTWVITARAKAKAKRPKDAATMIAMRRILDNPKRAWRNVSGIALAVFIAGITSICGFFGSAAVVDDANDPFTVFIRDIGTGGILTLVVRRCACRGQLRCDAGRQRVRSGRRISHAGVGGH